MLGLAAEQFKVVNVIIAWVAVLVVYNFVGREIAAKMTLHHKTML